LFRCDAENGANSTSQTYCHLSQITSAFSFGYLQLFREIPRPPASDAVHRRQMKSIRRGTVNITNWTAACIPWLLWQFNRSRGGSGVALDDDVGGKARAEAAAVVYSVDVLRQ
jgi:hypothetical protein